MPNMAGPKAGRQRMAIAAEGAAAHSQVEIVKTAKSPAVLELLGRKIPIQLVTVMLDPQSCHFAAAGPCSLFSQGTRTHPSCIINMCVLHVVDMLLDDTVCHCFMAP